MTQWIQTAGCDAVDLQDTDPLSITLHDISFALSHINRFTGHVGAYSVAQHSVLIARVLRDEGHDRLVQASGLFHDAHEAFVGDVSSPLKRRMRELGFNFADLERPIVQAVRKRFKIPLNLPPPVGKADLRMLVTEKRDLFSGPPPRPGLVKARPYGFRIRPWAADRSVFQFIAEAERLGCA